MFTFFLNTPYDWGYKLKPKEDIGGVYSDKTIPYPRGKSIGGTRFVYKNKCPVHQANVCHHCSVLNGMVYFRGHSKDFDEWEELGNPGWGWKDVKQGCNSMDI